MNNILHTIEYIWLQLTLMINGCSDKLSETTFMECNKESLNQPEHLEDLVRSVNQDPISFLYF